MNSSPKSTLSCGLGPTKAGRRRVLVEQGADSSETSRTCAAGLDLTCLETDNRREHPDGTVLDPVDGKRNDFIPALLRHDLEEREVVLRRGHAEAGVLAECLEIDERLVLPRKKITAQLFVEADGPVVGRRVFGPLDQTEIVHHVAAAEDEHPFVAQRREARRPLLL